MWKNRFLILVLFLLFQFFAFGQNEKAVFALKEILQQIERQHNIKFNYIEDEIVVFKLAAPPEIWSLQQKIAYLKRSTKLKFTLIDKKYYTISNDKRVDKPLCGYLLDAETNQPVENASVEIMKTQTNTATNASGYFQLPKVSSNDIMFRHQSYISRSIRAEELYVGFCPSILLTPFSQELSEVITSRFLTTGISRKKDGSIEIKPKKSGLLPGLTEPDVLQTLQQIPGISSIDETISNLNVRGGTHDQNLFLWNGIRMFQTGHFFGLISAFNPSIAHSISVSKNGSAAFYGESVSSLVDMSTHAKNIEDTKASISSNLISAEGYTKLKLSDNASIEVSGRRSLTDFFSSPTYKNYSNRVFQNTIITDLSNSATNPVRSDETFYFYDLTVQYQQKVGKRHEFWLDGIGIRNNLSVQQNRSTINRNSFLGQENFGGSLLWKSSWNTKHSTEVQLSTSYYQLEATNESVSTNQILNQKNSVLNMGISIKDSYLLSEQFTLQTGYQLDEIGVLNSDDINNPRFSRKVKEISLTHAGIASLKFQSKNNKTYLQAGARVNYFSTFQRVIPEPRIQFHQDLTAHLSLQVLAEQKSQTLSQIIDLQQDFLGIEKRRWTLANNNSIPITQSKQISAGLTYKDKSWLITWDNFFKTVKGITTGSQGFQNQFEFIKATGSYEVLGTELLVQRNFQKYNAWISYSYNDNEYRFYSLAPDFFPNNFELTHVVSAGIIYDWNQIKWAVGGKWNSGRPFTETSAASLNTINPLFPTINYAEPNRVNLPDYLQINISAAKEWKLNSRITLLSSFSVLNVINKANIIQRYYRLNESKTGIEVVNIYSLERTPNLSIKVSF